ncbi:hypothetical protein LTR97_003748 [Elasticomyces elasticus]|uniref:Uncharacterized protein n=1 Tax=Elasticomyces elasticus TaxID=574655 RepID=A0AAN7VTG4_9PEZI|nr:hypothetical protein LTR97_003748 [Elasticomyces elasticus]
MSMGVYLGLMTLWKTWSRDQDRLWTATVLAAAYYITQFSAYYYPGATAWDPPQHFSVPHIHLYVVVPMLSLVALAQVLERWRLSGIDERGRKAFTTLLRGGLFGDLALTARFRRTEGYETEGQGSYTGVAGIGWRSSLQSRGYDHANLVKQAKTKPKYVAGGKRKGKRAQWEAEVYQFWAHKHVEACDTVHLLEVDRREDSPRPDFTHDVALLFMEATFGPLNGSVTQDHHSSPDTRYRAILPLALLDAFDLPGSQPLSALSGPLKTIPFNSAIPTRSSIMLSPNHAPRLLRGTVVGRTHDNGKQLGSSLLLSGRDKGWRLPSAINNTMTAKGWSPETNPFVTLDVRADYHPHNIAGILQRELRPHYEHAGHISLQLFYYAGPTSTIESVWLPYESIHRPHEYQAAMAAQTIYEAAYEEVIPSNRRIESLSGISFEGRELGPEILRDVASHCLFCPESFGLEGDKVKLRLHLNDPKTPCGRKWRALPYAGKGSGEKASLNHRPFICEAEGCSQPFLRRNHFVNHLRGNASCLAANLCWIPHV